MSVRRDTRGRWTVDVAYRMPDGTERRVTRTSAHWTRREAEAWEREVRRRLADGTYETTNERKEVPTLEAFAGEFMRSYVAANNKPSEEQTKRSSLRNHLVPALGHLRLDQIGARQIEEFKAKSLERVSKKTVNNLLTVLRRMLVVAVEWGVIVQIPRIKWLKCPQPEFDFLTFEEADRLVAAAEDEWRTMIVVALRTGLRQGELLALRWDDVDLAAGRLIVRRNLVRGNLGTPKSGRNREVPLSDGTIRALKAHRHLRSELVFCQPSGEILNKEKCKHPIWRACKRAGLRRLGWHVCRHSFASHLAMRGVPLKVVQELLGHSTIQMTMRYAHLAPVVKRDAVALLDRPGADTAQTPLEDAANYRKS